MPPYISDHPKHIICPPEYCHIVRFYPTFFSSLLPQPTYKMLPPDSHAVCPTPCSIPQAPWTLPPDRETTDISPSPTPLPAYPSDRTNTTVPISVRPESTSSASRSGHRPDTSNTDLDFIHAAKNPNAADPTPRIAGGGTPNKPREKKNDTYVLQRTYLSSSRLNYQFYLWRETLPFPRLLHPCIPVPTPWPSAPQCTIPFTCQLGSSGPVLSTSHPYDTPPTAYTPPILASSPAAALQIADVATGTAIWPIQLARHLPASASICGFDISLSQAPPRAWLPRNLELREWDIFTPVPDDCLGKYDVVHVRLLLLVLTPANVRAVVRRLGQMLRDGGWLQWEELGLGGTYLQRAEGEEAAAAALPTLESVLGVLRREGEKGWVTGLEDAVRDEGFDDVQVERYTDGVQEARAVFEMHLIKDEEMARASGMDEVTRETALRRIDAMYDESCRGAVLCTPKMVCVARKRGRGMADGGGSDGERGDGERGDRERVDGDWVEERKAEDEEGVEKEEEQEAGGLNINPENKTLLELELGNTTGSNGSLLPDEIQPPSPPQPAGIEREKVRHAESKHEREQKNRCRLMWHEVFP